MHAQALRLEALSALLNNRVEHSSTDAIQLSPQDVVNIVTLRQFFMQEGGDQMEYPSLGTLSLVEGEDLYRGPSQTEEGSVASTQEGSVASTPEFRMTLKINLNEFFHPEYDYDFTRIVDGDARFNRGGERYLRPVGWNRFALRVPNSGAAWLGEGSDAWPVSYHGYKMDGSHGTVPADHDNPADEPGVLDAAVAAAGVRGRGVYSALDIKIAERFCKTFRSSTDGKTYKVILQNRISPEKRMRCQRADYWLVHVPEGSTDLETRVIVQQCLRPYGLLLKEA